MLQYHQCCISLILHQVVFVECSCRFSTETISDTDTQIPNADAQKTLSCSSDTADTNAQALSKEDKRTALQNLRPKTANAKNSSRICDNDVKQGLIRPSLTTVSKSETQSSRPKLAESQQLEALVDRPTSSLDALVDRPKSAVRIADLQESEPKKAYSVPHGDNRPFTRRSRRPSSQIASTYPRPLSQFASNYSHQQQLPRTMSASQPVKIFSDVGEDNAPSVLKNDMQEINYRLSHYIQHVRDLGHTPSGSGDSTVQLHHSLSTLELEIRNLKHIYETELDSMRCAIVCDVLL